MKSTYLFNFIIILCFILPAQVLAAIIYSADFENGKAPTLLMPFMDYRGRLDIIARDKGEPTYNKSKYSLRIAGTNIWNWVELNLDNPLPLTQPVYLICAIRSDGPTGEVKIGLKLAGRTEPLFSKAGPIGSKSTGIWETIVARLDQFDSILDQDNLVGVRISQRCAPGVELPWRSAPRHELMVDNVQILTGSDIAVVKKIAREHIGVREYRGPSKYVIQSNKGGVTVWHSPSTVPVLKNTVLPKKEGLRISLSAARGEGESFQLVVTPSRSELLTISLKQSYLLGPYGFKIKKKYIEWHPVRYVHIRSRLGGSIEMDWPDPLSWDRETRIESVKNVPFWVTVNVPASAVPGKYFGKVTVIVTGKETELINIPIELEVLPFELPFSPTFKTNQQLWGVQREHARPWLKELAARKMFDANIWYSNPTEQKWRMEQLGQNTIKINMVGGHGPKPIELSGNKIFTQEYGKIFQQLLKNQVRYLLKNQWIDKSFIYLWDENWGDHDVFDMVSYLIGLTREVTVDVPILAALPLNPQTESHINIHLSDYSPPEYIKKHVAKGNEFWRWGNVALELGNAPIVTRCSYGFEAVKLGCKGAYSWSVSAWDNRDPWLDLDSKNWIGSFFYPGRHIGSIPNRPVPSIRMELLRDGIEDFEYVTILKNLIKNSDSVKAQQAEKLIIKSLKLCDVSEGKIRCDQHIDDFIKIRKEFQYTISELLNGN